MTGPPPPIHTKRQATDSPVFSPSHHLPKAQTLAWWRTCDSILDTPCVISTAPHDRLREGQGVRIRTLGFLLRCPRRPLVEDLHLHYACFVCMDVSIGSGVASLLRQFTLSCPATRVMRGCSPGLPKVSSNFKARYPRRTWPCLTRQGLGLGLFVAALLPGDFGFSAATTMAPPSSGSAALSAPT